MDGIAFRARENSISTNMMKYPLFIMLFFWSQSSSALVQPSIELIACFDSIRLHNEYYQHIAINDSRILEDSMVFHAYSNPAKSIAFSLRLLDHAEIEEQVACMNAYYNIASQMLYHGHDIQLIIEYLISLEERIKDEQIKDLLVGHIALLKAISSDLSEDHVRGIKLDQKAIDHYERANHPNIIRAYGGLAILHYEMKFFEQSLQYYKIMFDWLEKYPDYENRILLLTNYVIMITEEPYFYSKKELLNEGIRINKQIFDLLQEKYIKRNYFWASINQFQLDQLSGRQSTTSLEDLSKTMDEIENYETKTYFYRLLAKHALKAGKKDKSKALLFANKAIQIAQENNSLEHESSGYNLLSEIYYAFNDIHDMRTAKIKADSLHDVLLTLENRALIANMEVSLNLKNAELENERIERDLFRQRILTLIAFIIAVLLFLMVFSFKRRLKLFNALKESESNLKKMNVDLAKKNEIIEEQKESLHEANIHLNDELKSSLLMLSSYLEIKNEIVSTIKNEHLEEHKKTNYILKTLNSTHNKQIINDVNFKFIRTNEQFHKNLISNFPDLTDNNIKLCILLKMQLTTKEIASLLYRSPSSIKVAKYRLRKKLGLNDQSVSLYAFLTDYE